MATALKVLAPRKVFAVNGNFLHGVAATIVVQAVASSSSFQALLDSVANQGVTAVGMKPGSVQLELWFGTEEEAKRFKLDEALVQACFVAFDPAIQCIDITKDAMNPFMPIFEVYETAEPKLSFSSVCAESNSNHD